MCIAFSCIVTKGKKVLICENPNIHNHEDIIKEHNLRDVSLINRTWLRIEVFPKNNDYTLNVDTWIFQVDEVNTLPEWFTLNKETYEKFCRKAAKTWKKKCVDKLGQYVVESANGNKEWYINGKYHRLDGPAKEYANGDKFWYKNGKLHREDGPACEYANGDKFWYKNSKPHREDGPAREYTDGYKEYWIEGKQVEESGLLV